MSREDPDRPTVAGERGAAPEPPGPPRPRRAPRLPRGWLLLAAGVALVLLAGRVALGLSLPTLFALTLEQIGLEGEVGDVDLALWRGKIDLRDVTVRLAGGLAPVARIERVEADLSMASLLLGKVRLQRASVRGLRGVLHRRPDGRLELVERIQAAIGPRPEKVKKAFRDPDFVVLGEMRVEDAVVHVIDLSVEPPIDAWVRLDAEAADLRPLSDRPWPNHARLRASATPYFEVLAVEGRPTAQGTTAVRLQLVNASRDAVEAYGSLIGLHAAAERYDLSLGASADRAPALAKQTPARLAVHDLLLVADGVEQLRIGLAVAPLTIYQRRVTFGDVRVRDVRARARRTEDGAWSLGALLRLGGAPGAEEAPEPPRAADAAGRPELRPLLQVDSLLAENLRVEVDDLAVDSALPSLLVARRLELGPLKVPRLPAQAAPAQLTLRAAAPGLAEELAIAGTVAASWRSLAVDLRVAADEVNMAAVAALAGASERTVDSASASLNLRARLVKPLPEAPLAVEADLSDLIVSAPEEEEPLLRLARLHLASPDLTALQVSSLRAEGLALDVHRDASAGALTLLGLRWTSPPSDEPAAPAPRPAEPPALPAGGRRESARSPAAPQFEGRARTMRLEALSLGIDRLRYQEGSRPPIELRDARLRLTQPLVVHGAFPAASPPVQLALTARLPSVERIELAVSATPFSYTPELRLTFTAAGIDLAALAQRTEAIPTTIEATSLLDVSLQASAQVTGGGPLLPTDRAMSEPVVFEARLVDLTAYAPAADQRAEIRGAQARGRYSRQGDGLTLEAVQVFSPDITFERHEGYYEVLGVRIPSADEEGADEEGADEEEPAQAAADAPAATGPARTIARVSIHEGRLDFVDSTGEAPVVVPLRQVAIELRNVPLGRSETPLSFDVVARGGEVTLPVRETLGGVLGDLVRDWSQRVRQAGTELERRPLFNHLLVRGRLTLGEPITGTTDVRLSRLEVTHFEPLIPSEDLVILDGLLDADVDLDFEQDGDLEISTTLLFQHLRADEPVGGPVMRFLGLPTPLDTTIFLLQDEDQQIQLSATVQLEQGRRPEQVAQAVLRAIGEVVSRAVLRAPFRVLGTIEKLTKATINLIQGDALVDREGLHGPNLDPVAVEFAPGVPAPQPEAYAEALRPFLERLRRSEQLTLTLRHEVGRADVALARRQANPSPADRFDALAALRRCRQELAARRRTLTAEAAEALREGDLQALERARWQLAGVMDGLGRVERGRARYLELYAPGADSAWARAERTREAVIRLGSERLEAVVARLRLSGIPNLSGRIEVLTPVQGEAKRAEGAVVVQPRTTWGETKREHSWRDALPWAREPLE